MTDLILITGGLPGEPQHATIGDKALHRAPGECLEAFKLRALAVAEASGAEFVVVDGLPPIGEEAVE